MITRRNLLAATAATFVVPFATSGQGNPARVTVLFDAFGKPSDLKRGWGYSAFIEYGGRRVLFDAGAKRADFAFNVSALKIDLKNLDFAVITHRHNDHTAGLAQAVRDNPGLTVYSPIEGAQFSSPMPPGLSNLIKRYVAQIPDDMRYFGGNPSSAGPPDPPWENAKFSPVTQPAEVLPDLFMFSTRSEVPGTREMNEVSLLMKTPRGGVLFVGCSHPGIEKIVEAAAKIEPNLYSVLGGFHLVDIPDEQVTEMVIRFRDKWKIERMAAGHCTGQFAFAEMMRIYGDKFDQAGVGTVIALPG